MEEESDLPETELVRRVAIDIGSGATKVVVADVDHLAGHIMEVLFSAEVC